MKRSVLLLFGDRGRRSSALDQWTKHWATDDAGRSARRSTVIGDLVRFTYTRNSGVAFGLGAGTAVPVLPVLDRRAVVAILWLFLRAARRTAPSRQIALALILGGALGNLVDRVTTGEVVDFIQVGWRQLALAGVQRGRLRGHGRRGAVRARLARRDAPHEADAARAGRAPDAPAAPDAADAEAHAWLGR